MSSFDSGDYRRFSDRRTGKAQPSYQVLNTIEKGKPEHSISEEKLKSTKKPLSNSEKRKTFLVSGDTETTVPAKRLRTMVTKRAAPPESETTRRESKATTNSTSARRVASKRTAAKKALRMLSLPSSPKNPQPATLDDGQEPQNHAIDDVGPVALTEANLNASPESVKAGERGHMQSPTLKASQNYPRHTASIELDEPIDASSRASIIDTTISKELDFSIELNLTDQCSKGRHAEAARLEEDVGIQTGNIVANQNKNVGLIEEFRHSPMTIDADGSPGHQTGANKFVNQNPQGDKDAGSAPSPSGLSSPPSGIVILPICTQPPSGLMQPIKRPRRNLKPIQRYGAPVVIPAQRVLTVDDVAYKQPAKETEDYKDSDEHFESVQDRVKEATVITVPEGDGEDELMSPHRKTAFPKPFKRRSNASLTPRVKLSKSAPLPPAAFQGDEATQSAYPELNNTVDHRLVELSLKLTAREPIQAKPVAKGEPEVWADSRQALCETVPYFKKPQGGCHQNDRHTYAFLFDNVGHCREYMDSDVIIARAGGSMEPDSSTGSMVQKKDHLMSEAQVQSMINDTALKNPLVIICGNKNQGAVCKMPHRYNVLGWYKPIAVWSEKTRGKGNRVWATIKYRFERLNSGTKSAWHETGSIGVTEEERQIARPLKRQSCHHCQYEYPIVYLVGWICLNQDCPQFWKLPTGEDAGYGKLHYNPAFLLHRTTWPVEEEPFSVRPPLPDVGKVVGDNLTRINTRGICCPRCGRCSSRRLFKGWLCDNVNCDYENFPKHIPVKIPMLHQPWESTGNGPALARNKHEKDAKVEVSYKHGFKIYTYTFEGINGKFVHAAANAAINRQPGGADEMFRAIQNQHDPEMDLRLERRRFGVEKMASSKADVTLDSSLVEANEGAKKPELEDGDFMTAFSMNYGMPYKFVASGSSMPFTDAPWPIRACRADLNWASQTFLDLENHVDFNEELIFAYMEGQKIEYHDDGESGLGPRITTLSLGGKARMHMRMKMKHYVGCSKTGILTAELPVPGGIGGDEMYRKRLEAWNELQAVRDTDKTRYDQRRKEIPKELGLYEKRMKKAEDLVTITLNHGDIVLMEGYEIQQYLEHKVVPEGPLRFALTCRTVLPDHLRAEELPSYEVETDDESMSGLRKMAAAQEQQQQPK